MALTGVVGADPRAAALARDLDLPLLTTAARGGDGVRLIVGPDALALGFDDPKRGKPFAVDFLSPTWRERLARPLPRAHALRRALGEHRTVIDATAGFGGDAALMLTLGGRVTAVERAPVVMALLADGVRRAEGILMFKHLTLVRANATEYLARARADVIYLDPMFTKPKSSAKSPKEMQLLQSILESPEDEGALFAAAYVAARKRVVVKRPLKGRPMVPRPSHAFAGQSIRYDVYVKN